MKIQSPVPQANFTLIADNGCIRFGRVEVIPTEDITTESVQLELELKLAESGLRSTNI